MSNNERQRKFRERNPGYYRKYYGAKRRMRLAATAKLRADRLAAANAPAPREPLMLPAPVELPNAIDARPGATPLPVAPVPPLPGLPGPT